MNDKVRMLIRHVCSGSIGRSQAQARIILNEMTAQKDSCFVSTMIKQLDDAKTKLIELPQNLKGILVVNDSSNFPTDRFLVKADDYNVALMLERAYSVSDKLAAIGVSYVPSLILHGISGVGKTMLARYIAYQLKVPFAYIRFSALVDSHLGNTQKNISRVFDYAKSTPCVLCVDEIDAIGTERGDMKDVGEMKRIVISLMQELDALPNNVVVIGTTNRYEQLDPALSRRFSFAHKMTALNDAEALLLAEKFFNCAGYCDATKEAKAILCCNTAKTTPDRLVKLCTQKLIEDIVTGAHVIKNPKEDECENI